MMTKLQIHLDIDRKWFYLRFLAIISPLRSELVGALSYQRPIREVVVHYDVLT